MLEVPRTQAVWRSNARHSGFNPAQFWGYRTDRYSRDRGLKRPAELSYMRLQRKGKEQLSVVLHVFACCIGILISMDSRLLFITITIIFVFCI